MPGACSHSRPVGWLGLMLARAALGCADPSTEGLGTTRFELIGGEPAAAAEFDHTGAFVATSLATDTSLLLCAATLIGPQTVVTAKHCVEGIEQVAATGLQLAWARGADFGDPDELIRVVAIEEAPHGGEPGALGNGRDVAVLHLDETVEVNPMKLGQLGGSSVGAKLLTLGYGATEPVPTPSDGLRRIGRETVVATQGRLFEAIYGDFETYVEVEVTGQSTDADAIEILAEEPALADVEALADAFETTTLLDGYEVVTKTLEGDTRNCQGDSGGPLASRDEYGQWTSYGVFSGAPRSNQSQCDFAQVYATFGAATLEFLEQARDWCDPCGSVDQAGECSGDRLLRCEGNLDGRARQLIDINCSDLGATCRISATGAECSASP
jgi:secreted trypsin-like serine protease